MSEAWPLLIVGAGGHAGVVADLALAHGRQVLGYVAPRQGEGPLGLPILGDDDWLLRQDSSGVVLANGLGGVGDCRPRGQVFERFKAAGFTFAALAHPSAIVSRHAVLEEGAQTMAGAVVQPGATIGVNAIVNTGAVVEHDCIVGEHAHIAPRAVLCGGVRVGALVHVGVGASVIQGVSIGAAALIAAGSLVTRDVAPAARIRGVPAREWGDVGR